MHIHTHDISVRRIRDMHMCRQNPDFHMRHQSMVESPEPAWHLQISYGSSPFLLASTAPQPNACKLKQFEAWYRCARQSRYNGLSRAHSEAWGRVGLAYLEQGSSCIQSTPPEFLAGDGFKPSIMSLLW